MTQFVLKSWTRTLCAIAITAGMLCPATSVKAAESAADHPPPAETSKIPDANEAGLVFIKDGAPQLVIRDKSALPMIKTRDAEPAQMSAARAIVNALFAGPDEAERAEGIEPFLPEGTTLGKIDFDSTDTIRIYVDIPPDFIAAGKYTGPFIQVTFKHFTESLFPLGFNQFYYYVKDPATGDYVQVYDLLPAPEIKEMPQSESDTTETATTTRGVAPRELGSQNGFVDGALTGKHVVINASHGWHDDCYAVQRWRTQRPNCWEVVEDFSSAMFMNHYVIPMLENAGAIVRPVREIDTQTNLVVVDNSMGAPRYVESGSGWINSQILGYTHKETLTGKNDNPFGSGYTSRLIRGTSGSPTASATFTPTIPADGYYNVYIAYTAGSDRTDNAHWQIHHSGGVTDFRVNQNIGGSTWFLLGNFYFEKDAPASQAKVVGLNDSGDTGYLSVDAVRLGGGMGRVARWDHGVSGRPSWQEEATNYLQYTGMLNGDFKNALSTGSDPKFNTDEAFGWVNRPYYARWVQSRDGLGRNLVYIGWHTNASGSGSVNGAGRGTLVIRDVDDNATADTKNLTSKVFNGMLYSVRSSYDSSWRIRGAGIVKSNQYGESLQSRLTNGVAGFFFEGLFHDNNADAAAYKDGKFRYAAARGIVNGLIQYYNGSVFPPEPVKNFRVKNIDSNKIRLEWNRGPTGNTANRIGSPATNFRVYSSTNGYGFDNGVEVGNTTSHEMTVTPGELQFLRVAAVNSAGLSIPSETLAARAPLNSLPTSLIVNGYQRDDQFIAPMIYASQIGGSSNITTPNYYREMDPRKYQSLNYTIQHAKAIVNAGGYGIDSCSNDVINSNQYNLENYPMVFWIGGQQAEADPGDGVDYTAFRAAERTAVANYLSAGGRFMVSGSELGWDQGRSAASQAERLFYNNYLKAGFTVDDTNTYTAIGNGGILAGIGAFSFDNGSGNTYDVRMPDAFTPLGGASSAMSYSGGTGGTAALQYSGTFGSGTTPGKLFYMGFGFETISSEAKRNDLMERVITYFLPAGVRDWGLY